MSDSFVRLAQRLRDTRLEQKLSQEFVAQAAGISVKTLQRAELQGVMSAETAKALRAVLNIEENTVSQALPKHKILFSPKPKKDILKNFLKNVGSMALFLSIFPGLPGLICFVNSFDQTLSLESQRNYFFFSKVFFFVYGVSMLWCSLLFKKVADQERNDDLRKQRIYAILPTLTGLLDTIKQTIENPQMTAPEAVSALERQVQEVFQHHQRLETHDLDLRPLLYFYEDLTRGLSPRKRWKDYVRAQQAAFTLVFEDNPRLKGDLEQEIRRFHAQTGFFVGPA